MSRKRIILSAVFLLSVSFIFLTNQTDSRFAVSLGNAVYATAEEKDNTICNGVFIDEVDVSGMTKTQAETAVSEFVEGLRNKGIAIKVGENVVYSTLGDLGYTNVVDDNVDQALALGKSGNLIKRYKDLKDIEQGNIYYSMSFTFDENKIRDIISVDVSAYNVAPVNATVSRKDGEFIYTDHVVGSKVNVEETTKLVSDAINNWNRQDIIIDAAVDDDMPQYTKDKVELCNTVLGTYTTEYADSAEGRAKNLANGARLINNAVLYPGEVFSAYEYLTPFTADNGYYVAGAYLQGKVIDSVGGGACQVTTTLYNAVLDAELEVVERQPHSMTISYVKLSRDAAIAGTYKDFKFKNSTDVPMIIEATTVGRKITFKLWGHETRDTKNREIKYETVVLSETPPPADVITEDPTQPTTYKKVTQGAHTGYKAELYKIVYENGVEVSRTLVNKSNYAAAPNYITVGTMEVPEIDGLTDPDNPDSNNPDADNPDTDKPSKPVKPGKPNTNKPNTDNPDTENNDMDAEDEEPIDENQLENQSVPGKNQTNPDDQIQADIWDPAWDSNEFEDE